MLKIGDIVKTNIMGISDYPVILCNIKNHKGFTEIKFFVCKKLIFLKINTSQPNFYFWKK